MIDQIIKAFAKSKLSMGELAKRCGWLYARTDHYIKKRRAPNEDALATLAKALGLKWKLVKR